MKVYRILSEFELNKIKQNETSLLGSNFSKTDCNTHKYNKDKKYMHFFLNKKSAYYFQTEKNKNYLCTFNVPINILIKSVGIGYYPSKNENENRGYDSVVNKKIEFAISTDKFRASWLKKVEKIKIKNNNEI